MKVFIQFACICFIYISSNVFAADSEGKFAAKGAGRKACEDFVVSFQQKDSEFLLYAGWLEGYLSAYNQFQNNNYDIAPWQTTELFLILLQRHCSENSNVKFLDATNTMIRAFYPIRMDSEGTVVKVQVGDATAYYYKEILLRAKTRLKKMGFYPKEISGDKFTDEDIKAFSDYQQKFNLKVTGLPDQNTLTTLFLKANPN